MTLLPSLLQAAAKFELVRRDMEDLGPAIVAEACRMVATEARRVLGTYDYGWKKRHRRWINVGPVSPGLRCVRIQ